jgi:hypothetical protein
MLRAALRGGSVKPASGSTSKLEPEAICAVPPLIDMSTMDLIVQQQDSLNILYRRSGIDCLSVKEVNHEQYASCSSRFDEPPAAPLLAHLVSLHRVLIVSLAKRGWEGWLISSHLSLLKWSSRESRLLARLCALPASPLTGISELDISHRKRS